MKRTSNKAKKHKKSKEQKVKSNPNKRTRIKPNMGGLVIVTLLEVEFGVTRLCFLKVIET